MKFQGSLLKSNDFRLDAGPEVDAAWKSLGADYRAARIPTDEAERSGLASDQVKIKEEYGGGLPAHVEGLHHLHCLVCGKDSGAEGIADVYTESATQVASMELRLLPKARSRAIFERWKHTKVPY